MNFLKLKHIMVLTGEPSGDLHAGPLVKAIKHDNNHIYFSGIGGPHLAQQKVDLFYPISNLSAMGVTEVVMQFRQIKHAFDLFKKKLRTHTPDLIILVDYPGFNLKAAQFAKDHYAIKILYYITPKVWAWKKSRLKKIKKYVDYCALILPFEEKIFKRAKIAASYVGNPLVEAYPETLSKPFRRSAAGSPEKTDTLTIGLLPGSRTAEIQNLLGTMIQAALLIHQKKLRVRFLISQSTAIQNSRIETILNGVKNRNLFSISDRPVKDIFLKADLVVAASGTATLEAALCCVPTLIVYKMSPVSYRIAKLLVTVKYAGLANLIANREVMPELLQAEANPEKISEKALTMLDHLEYYENQLDQVRKLLGNRSASKRTANMAIHMLKETDR